MCNVTERRTRKALFEEYAKCLEEFEMTEKTAQPVTDANTTCEWGMLSLW